MNIDLENTSIREHLRGWRRLKIITLLLILLTATSMFFIIIWLVSTVLTFKGTTRYGWASYRTFKKEYMKRDWAYKESRLFTRCLITHDERDYINSEADSIVFDGTDMIINNPIGYVLMKMFIRKEVSRLTQGNRIEKVKVKW